MTETFGVVRVRFCGEIYDDWVPGTGTAEVLVGDLVLHRVHSSRETRRLHGFWDGRVSAPTGIFLALESLESRFKEGENGA